MLSDPAAGLARALQRWRQEHPGERLDPGPALVAVAVALAGRHDATGTVAHRAPLLSGRWGPPAHLPPEVLDALAALGSEQAPDALGLAHEALLDAGHRQRGGVFYTPAEVADGVVALAAEGWAPPGGGPPTACDPACGGGAFLLATARHLLAAHPHLGRAGAVGRLWGLDVDPLAADVADAALRLWAAVGGEAVAAVDVAAGDALAGGEAAWVGAPPGFDLVVGNPPFQSQLARATARSRPDAAALRARLGDPVQAYADTSALFLVAALGLVAPGGRVALVLPESFLAADHARPARGAVVGEGAVVGLWLPRQALFAASVRVCVPVVERGADPPEVARWLGPDRRPAPPAPVGRADLAAAPTWGALVGDLRGAPAVALAGPGTLGSLATATAGFRAQFYGVAPFVVDDDRTGPGDGPRPPLVTSGLIDPARLRWGSVEARFAGRRWRAPRVDLAALAAADPAVARWGRDRLVPKVLVATQTRVVEAVVDERGAWWPSVPVVSVEADPEALWHVAAVLLAPAVSAWAVARYGGAALSGDAVKLAASHVLQVPLPAERAPWDEAADRVRAASAAAAGGDPAGWRLGLVEAGRAMGAAYRAAPEVLAWWEARLPPLR